MRTRSHCRGWCGHVATAGWSGGYVAPAGVVRTRNHCRGWGCGHVATAGWWCGHVATRGDGADPGIKVLSAEHPEVSLLCFEQVRI